MHWTDVKSLQVSLKKYDLENLDGCVMCNVYDDDGDGKQLAVFLVFTA